MPTAFIRATLLLACSLSSLIFANAEPSHAEVLCRNPYFENGVVATHEGARIHIGELYIQARHLSIEKGKIIAHGQILVTYHNNLLTGTKLVFDIHEGMGTVENATFVQEPWFLQARRATIFRDGSFQLKNASFTTCPTGQDLYNLTAQHLCVKNQWLHTQALGVGIGKMRLFSLPEFAMNLQSTGDSPFSLTFAWGGFLGSIIGVRYRFIDTPHARASIEAMYAFGRGPGLAMQTRYCCGNQKFLTNSIAIRDRSYDDAQLRLRYSLQGTYCNKLYNDHLELHGQYDIDSDTEMDSDFGPKRFSLPTAESTNGWARWEESNWLSILRACIRVNPFQSVNQQLPAWELALRPLSLKSTGIISSSRFRTALLDYVYSDLTPNLPAYHSSRLEWVQTFYRPFANHWGVSTPKLTLVGRFYGNSVDSNPLWQGNVVFQWNNQIQFHRDYHDTRHVIQPYCRYFLMSAPTNPLRDQYVFTLADGYNRLQYVQVGLKQLFFEACGSKRLLMSFDTWTHSYIDVPTQPPAAVAEIYANCVVYPTSFLTCTAEVAWNNQFGQLDHSNARVLWTISRNLAWSVECRHRGPYDWRKADPDNYVLNSFQTIDTLLYSSLSDRRTTILSDIYWRFHPDLQWNFQIRTGWDRRFQPSFLEYKNAFEYYLGSHWYLLLSHEHLESDERYTFSCRFAY